MHHKLTKYALASLALILSLFASAAADVTLAWDGSPDTNVVGYYLYAGTNDFNNTNTHSAPIRSDVGTNLLTTISVTNGATWNFVVTAYAQVDTNRFESDISNQVSVRFPVAPSKLLILVQQYSANIATTNWQDLGFFRIKLGGP